MRGLSNSLVLVVVLACPGVTPASAAEISAGAALQVKPNSIWFEDAAGLARWQAKKRGDAAVFAAYEERLLHAREAWQFINSLPVKILRYEPAKHRVNVQMTGEGRLRGSKWYLDPAALEREGKP